MNIKKTKYRGISKVRLVIFSLIGLVVVVLGVVVMKSITKPVLDLKEAETECVYIPTGATFDDVRQLLLLQDWLSDDMTFTFFAQWMNYISNVKPGCYELRNGMTARELVTLLRSGNQKAQKLTFNNVRQLQQLAGKVASVLECDSVEYLKAMTDEKLISEMGFKPETFAAMFIPNTYHIFWNTDGEEWVRRMKKEYDRFWNDERQRKADSLGLSRVEVSTLASIIEEETNKRDEYPIIAGLYLNRLRIGMPMQACPTIKFALGDFTKRRILTKDLQVDSPYNTYINKGLPPGPIRVPSIQVIDAVLNAVAHKYLYMCARPDGSGRHNFATNGAEHARNARIYQQELNKKKIYK